MCREGGCGSCLINVEIYDYVNKGPKNIALNTVILLELNVIFILI